jgi:hypothetical protein
MSVEKPSLEELIGLCESEAEKRKWFEGAASALKGLKGLTREREQAERARDEAIKAKDAALKEIDTKRAKYEADMKAALADLERVTQEKADAAKVERGKWDAALAKLRSQVDEAYKAKELAEAQLAAYREEADRESVAIADALKVQRVALADSRERLSAVLKG